MKWPNEDVEHAKKRWLEGISAGVIEHELCYRYTRSAIIGMMHRSGTQTPRRSRSNTSQRPRRRVQYLKGSISVPPRVVPGSRPGPAEVGEAAGRAPPLPPTVARSAVSITLSQLHDNTCRWPVGDATGERQFFCGVVQGNIDVRDGHPYCFEHTAVAAGPAIRIERGHRPGAGR